MPNEELPDEPLNIVITGAGKELLRMGAVCVHLLMRLEEWEDAGDVLSTEEERDMLKMALGLEVTHFCFVCGQETANERNPIFKRYLCENCQ